MTQNNKKKTRKEKAHPLTIAMQIRIAKHKEKYPEMPYTALAELFNVTYDQARQSHKRFIKGRLNRGTKRMPVQSIEKIKNEKSANAIIDSQFHTALASLEQDNQISAIERINALEKISRIKKLLQSVELTEHIKRADSDVIAAIIRRFLPDASNEEIIKIYREEYSKLEMEKGNWNT